MSAWRSSGFRTADPGSSPRVDGPRPGNLEGPAFNDGVVDELDEKRGIEPLVTISHYETPLHLPETSHVIRTSGAGLSR